MGQISLTTSLVLIGLFTIAILSFALNFAIDNDAAVSIADDPEMSTLSTSVIGNASAFEEDATSTYSSIIETEISTGGTTSRSGSQYSITFLNAFGAVKNIMLIGYVKIFGSGSGFGIFLTTFLGLITFMIGLYVVKTWIGGNPD